MNLPNLLVCMALDLFEELAFCRNGFLKRRFEVWFGGGGVRTQRECGGCYELWLE